MHFFQAVLGVVLVEVGGMDDEFADGVIAQLGGCARLGGIVEGYGGDLVMAVVAVAAGCDV